MIIFSTLIQAVAQILHMVINMYMWVVIIATLITWVRPDPYNPIVQVLNKLTNPVFDLVRRYIPSVIGGIDISPIIIILALQFLDLFLVRLLFSLANAL